VTVANLEQFCAGMNDLLKGKPDQTVLTSKGRALVGELMSSSEWFGGVIEKILFDKEFSATLRPGIWTNEITLYRSPDRSFLILCYIWEPGVFDTIHDHGAWGIIGSLIGHVGERKYVRLDDGSREGYAELEDVSSVVLKPGDTTYVLPLNKGIHRMENYGKDTAVTINVYGPNIRKGYVQFFYPEVKSVSRVYPPKTMKEVLSVRALGSVTAPWSKDLLKRILTGSFSDYIKKEGEVSLARIGG